MAQIYTTKEDERTREMVGLVFLNMEKTKYNIFTSEEVYSIYFEILKGNNTYELLRKKTDKTKPQLVEIMQPLLKSRLVLKKAFTGTKGNPLVFTANREAYRDLFYEFFKESGFSEKEIMHIKLEIVKDKIERFIEDKNHFLKNKNFRGLSESFFKFAGVNLDKNSLFFN